MPAHKGYIRATPHGPDRPDDWRDRAECKAAARAQNTRYNERKNAKRRIERARA